MQGHGQLTCGTQSSTLPRMILLHATCVAIGDIGVLIRGRSGSGKSDLALRLIDAGAALVADDYCELVAEGDALVARAPALIAGKMEIRGYGIAPMPARDAVRIGLVVDLAPWGQIPRIPDETSCVLAGVRVAAFTVDPAMASAAAKVRVVAQLGRAPAAAAAAHS
jgi:serine kinase of HPr protein (carbohydrate metabolism regulator)